jgi:hypothetical protein
MHAVSEPEDPKTPHDPKLATDGEPSAPAGEAAAAPAPADAPLAPAQPEPEELSGRPGYMPKIRWGAILGIVGAVILAISFYQAREAQRSDELRRQLLESHERQLSTVSERYQAFRSRIERWTMEAATAGEPEQMVDPRLRVAGLHDGEGLYLRLLASDATSPEGVARGATSMETDALTRCLGIAPLSARGLYEHGDFLMPEWVEGVRDERDFLRLRVLDEQLAGHVVADLPVLSTLMQAEYFLLVLQQGENRRDAPVDVYLWDLREERQLLAARIQARGVLLPVHIRSLVPEAPAAPSPEAPPSMTSGGAHDCSIASQIKALTGEAAVAVSSVTVPPEVVEAIPDAPADAPVEAPVEPGPVP